LNKLFQTLDGTM